MIKRCSASLRLGYMQGSKGLTTSSDVADWPKEEPTTKLLLRHTNHILQVEFHPPAVIYLGIVMTSLFSDQIWSNFTSFLPNSCGKLSSFFFQFFFFICIVWENSFASGHSSHFNSMYCTLTLFSSFSLYCFLYFSRTYLLFLRLAHWFLAAYKPMLKKSHFKRFYFWPYEGPYIWPILAYLVSTVCDNESVSRKASPSKRKTNHNFNSVPFPIIFLFHWSFLWLPQSLSLPSKFV